MCPCVFLVTSRAVLCDIVGRADSLRLWCLFPLYRTCLVCTVVLPPGAYLWDQWVSADRLLCRSVVEVPLRCNQLCSV